MRNLPFHGYDQNRIWLALALLAWMPMLALAGHPASDGIRKPYACGCSRSQLGSHATPAELTFAYQPAIGGPA